MRDARGRQEHPRAAPRRELDGVRLCPDDWLIPLGIDPHDAAQRRRLEALQWSQALRLAELGLTVVVEFGSWSRVERRRMRDQVREAGLAVELRVLDVPLEERWSRIELRNREPGAVVISREQLERYERYWQAPTPEEQTAYDRQLGAL